MNSPNPKITAYIKKAPDFARPILEHIRAAVHAGCPAVEETLKWGVPHFVYRKSVICMMAAFKAHCRFGFWKPGFLKGLPADKTGYSIDAIGKVTSLKDLPSRAKLIKVVKLAAKAYEQGIKLPAAKKKAPKPVVVPPELQAALKKNKPARAAFQAFPPSHQREYCEWIAEAKQESTRTRRLEQTLTQLAAGKSINWKYEAKTKAKAAARS